MVINGNDIANTVFSGKGSKANNYLVAAAQQFYKQNLELEANIRYAQPVAFKIFIEKLRTEKLKFLTTYLQTHQLDVEFINYAKSSIDYWHAFHLKNYPYEHPLVHDQPAPMEVPEITTIL